MTDYQLQYDEGVTLESENSEFRRSDDRTLHSTHLVLTNKNLLYVREKIRMFGANEVYIDRYPLRDIKVIDGKAQIRLTKHGDCQAFAISMRSGEVTFYLYNTGSFKPRKETIRWANAISMAVTGKPLQENTPEKAAIPGVGFLAETIKGTVDTFKEAWGGTNTPDSPQVSAVADMVSAKCTGCRAPLSGVKGQRVQCRYCDTEQVL